MSTSPVPQKGLTQRKFLPLTHSDFHQVFPPTPHQQLLWRLANVSVTGRVSYTN